MSAPAATPMMAQYLAMRKSLDESSGRAMARNLNIRITGTRGVLLKAKRDVSPSKHRQNQASCH